MRSIPLAAGLTLSSLLVACGAGESAATTDAPPAAEAIAASVDYDAVAGNVVRNVASIREGDRVLIYGNVRDMELLESLAVQTRAAGAFPAMSAYGPDLLHRLYDEVPARYDTQVNEFDLELTEILTAMISVDFAEAEDLLAGAPPERIAARAEANAPIAELAQQEREQLRAVAHNRLASERPDHT